MLPQRLVDCDCDRIAQVQAAQGFPHGNTHAAPRLRPQQPLGQPRRLLAKYEIAAVRVGDVAVTPSALGREEKQLVVSVPFQKFDEILIIRDVHFEPVV